MSPPEGDTKPGAMDTSPQTHWKAGAERHTARWRSESGLPPPPELHPADDQLAADEAWRRMRGGEYLLYRGDYRNAQQLLTAVRRRLEKMLSREKARQPPASLSESFHAERRSRLVEHELLSRIVLPLDAEYRLMLKRAPDVREMCLEVWGPPDAPYTVVSLRELLGMLGATEWRRKGVPVKALGGARVHPYYGVFAPTRQEYVDLVAGALFPPSVKLAFDIGTGTGVLALLLARRGAERVVATDADPRAVACARENVERLGLTDRIEVRQQDVFPEGRADLVVCNPPWIPAEARSPVDRAIFDPEGRFLAHFLSGLPEHLNEGGQGWLVLSDLAERLGLRPAGYLEEAFAQAGLKVTWTREVPPRHPRAYDKSDPLHEARSREVTRVVCLVRR